MRAAVAVGLVFVVVGLGLWWSVPNMAAPLVGLVLATVGVAVTVAGIVVGKRAGTRQTGEPTDGAGWAIGVGGSMSGLGRVGEPDGPPPQMTAVLPDGRELTADEHGAFDIELPDHTRIFISGEFVFEIDDEAAEREVLSNPNDVP